MRKYLRLGAQVGPYIVFRVGKIRKYSKNPSAYPLEDRFAEASKYMRAIDKKGFHMQFIIKGQENLPPKDRQVIFYGNHIAVMDAVSFIEFSDRPMGFLAKDDVKTMPIVGTVATSLNSLYMDRDDLRSEIKLMMQLADLLKNNPGLSYVIFPEGTRSDAPDFNLLPFHPGSFKVAMKIKAPIVPFCTYMTDRVLNQHYHYRKYPVQVTYLKPIYPEEYEDMTTQQVAEIVKERIAAELEIQKANDRELVKTLNGYSDEKTDRVLHYIPTEKDVRKHEKKKAKRAAKHAKKEAKQKKLAGKNKKK